MTEAEKIKIINEEINMLQEELDDQILLEKYYSGTEPKYKEYLEKNIKIKDRLRKITKLLQQNRRNSPKFLRKKSKLEIINMNGEIFTQDQKTIIRRVRNLTYGYKFLANVIDPEMYNSRIQVDLKNKRAFVLIQKPLLPDKTYEKHIIRQTFNWVNYLIDISFVLIDTLVEFDLAKKLRPNDIKEEIVIFGPGAINMPFEQIEITDKKKVSALLEYADIQLEINDSINNLI